MLQKHIQSVAMAMNASPPNAVDYARRAAEERHRAAEASNEVLASVHESLARRFAARAAESALAGDMNAIS